MTNFNLYKDKKQLKELIELRDEINSTLNTPLKLKNRVIFWYYVKVLSFFIAIYKFIVSKEESEL